MSSITSSDQLKDDEPLSSLRDQDKTELKYAMASPRHSITSPRRSMTITSPRRSINIGRRRSSDIAPPRKSSTFHDGERSVPMGPPRRSMAVGEGAERPEIKPDEPAPGPPPLEYSLAPKWFHLTWFWSLIFIDSVLMPIGLYFGLHYGTDLSPNTVFSIVTAAIGGISILEYFTRLWRLFKKNSTCRVIGGRRAYLDWFHWCFTAMWVIVMIELIIGTIPEYPPIRLIAMPLSTLLWTFGTILLVSDIMRLMRIPSPIRLSSIPKGSVLRPAIYTFIEDVVAVDGRGGTAYRERLNARYEASHYFRQMLHRLTLFWGFGCEGMAIITTILVFTLPDEAAYAVGWSLPAFWVMLWALITWWYVEKDLKMEKEKWPINGGLGPNELPV